ncbi:MULTISPECIES: class I SAM-dependent methyltransferase [Streptomyces]|uniref:class I SAM-dependent methyltransferase n=1 Tax=Streptomyces TaxID=1883 RepID=UPI0004CAB1CC|nr:MULTISPECIES: class I SAM-dependent methyltransferase [Streptomyces]AOW86586.1 transferase [Streptomyces olivaceus]MBZ6101962.1 class I SAM-dependent methyltransferase [Streptomyces olivaceus]MBZ6111308.1 class I SAM-dependent methyltransferase [Streptomyces olivaceus]MBZ6125277.1 class I SAM-dependent methyltransferase [Streptomyces olivaceus]MBZ6145644.1 class I SAM-dependent methyltransferase [Streptomyces olivaceus]
MSAPPVPPVPPVVPPAPAVPALPPVPRYGPSRADCPWCGSRRLRTRLRREEPGPGTPGRPVLERCADCRYGFWNPPAAAEPPLLRAAVRLRHRSAARALFRRCPGPESWLDVGTGDADFPCTARAYFPYTSFDGLDATHRVLRARAAERVEEAYVGRLTDPHIAARLRARYDVVSLFQYLERLPDPRAELRAAVSVLRPGGHLLVDAADPRRPLPVGLGAELVARGCTLLTGDRSHRVLARKETSAP